MAEFLGELVGNANEHTNTDCILDIDVTEPKYVKKMTTLINYFMA